jgi:outer membrane protein TolC
MLPAGPVIRLARSEAVIPLYRAAWAVLAGALCLAGTAGAAPALPLERAEQRALAHHPELAELAARVRAAEARAVSAGALPDPSVTLGAANLPTDTFDPEQEPMTQLQLGIHQDFPAPGSRAARARRQEQEGAVQRHRLADARADLVRRVRQAWLEAFYLERALAVVRDNLALFEEMIAIAQSQYRVGQGLQQSVLLAELERDRLLDERDRLKHRRAEAGARLAALIADGAARFELPAELPSLPEPPGEEALLAGLDNHPSQKAAQARIEREAAGMALADSHYYPDTGLDVTYGHRPGSGPSGDAWADFISAKVSVSLPLFTPDRQDRELAAARAERNAARRQKQRQLLQLQRRARSQYAAWRSARRRAERYTETILASSEQNVASAEAAYTTGKLDFLDLVRARIEDFEHHLKRWRVRVDAAQARADLLYLASQGSKP